MNIGARQGLINKLSKGRKASSGKGENKGRAPKIRVACPVCPPPSGDLCLYISVGTHSKTAKCKNGHIFMVGAGLIPANESYLLN